MTLIKDAQETAIFTRSKSESDAAEMITIVVPTFNGYQFLNRLFQYYVASGYPARLLVLDSSNDRSGADEAEHGNISCGIYPQRSYISETARTGEEFEMSLQALLRDTFPYNSGFMPIYRAINLSASSTKRKQLGDDVPTQVKGTVSGGKTG